MSSSLALLLDPAGESVVGQARTAAARVLARKLLSSVDRTVVFTPSPATWADIEVEVIPDAPGPWRFGRSLGEFIRGFRPQRLLYFSAGSGFMLSEEELSQLAQVQVCPQPFAVLNNFYSTDFGLICPPRAEAFTDLSRDNPLGLHLWRAGYRCYELPRTAATQLDIDTPGELQLLALWPELPQELGAALAGVPTDRARRIVELLSDSEVEVLLLGRVGGHVLSMLEREAACRVRVLSEERGMEASGRERGGVHSLLGSIPSENLVEVLSQLADGVVWDTRVLLAHHGPWPPAEERFAADLLRWEEVQTPFLRELTRACADSPTPFLLGGHSLVSGGMYLAARLAWALGEDHPTRFAPLSLADYL
jgi:hypothetical protein